MVQIRPMRMRVHHGFVLMRMAVLRARGHSLVGMQMVAIVVAVNVFVPRRLVRVDMRMAFQHEQADRRGEKCCG